MFEIILFHSFSWIFSFTRNHGVSTRLCDALKHTLNNNTKTKTKNIERTCSPIEVLQDFTLPCFFAFSASTQRNIFVNISWVVWRYVKRRLCWNYWCWTLCLRGKSRWLLRLLAEFQYQIIPSPKDNAKISLLQLSVYQLFASSKLQGWMSCLGRRQWLRTHTQFWHLQYNPRSCEQVWRTELECNREQKCLLCTPLSESTFCSALSPANDCSPGIDRG